MRFKLLSRVLIHQLSFYSTDSIGLYNNRSLNVCLFGHHQSGKTVLCSTITKLLSKVNSTRHVPVDVLDSKDEEKRLRSTVNLSFAPVNTGNTSVTLIDSPGRDDLIRIKIRGLTLAHIGILVVASDETRLIDIIHREVALAKHFKVKDIILFLTDKSSPVARTESTEEAKRREIQKVVSQFGYQDNPIFSNKTIDQLISYIDQYPIPQRNTQCSLLLKIVQVKLFSRNDAYVFGYLKRGKLEVGQSVTVLGKGREFDVTISKIVSSPMGYDKVEAGHLCELMIRGNRCKWLTKGLIVTKTGAHQASDNINCSIRPFPSTISANQLIETMNRVDSLSLYSDQIANKCFIRNIDQQEGANPINTQSPYVFSCNLKLSHSLILSVNHPIALALDKQLIGLGRVDQILTNLNADEKLRLFLKI